ncbi:MAG TPA: MFS transporter [Chloroflexota bacterium]|nr:MFS transporter [Chloroflexota bacterium]
MTAPLPLHRNRDYLLLWSGQTVSAVGSQISGFVIPLLVLILSRSPAQAGLAGALEGVPYILFSLPAGALADRVNRKSIMIVADVVRAGAMLSIPLVLAVGHLTIPQIYVVAVLEGTMFTFFNIAETSSLVHVISRDQLPTAIARQETTWAISALAGPPLGGILFAPARAALPFLADAVSYVVSALSLTAIRRSFQADRQAGEPAPRLRTALEWLWRQPLLRFLTVFSAAGDLLFSGIGLLPMVVARQQMHASPFAISLIFSLAAVGGLAGSALSGKVARRTGFSRAVIGSSWILAVLYPLLALAPNPAALGLIRGGMSATVSMSNTVRLSYPLSLIPDPLQGRVNSITGFLAYGSLPVGQFLTGLLLQDIGATRTILLITACLFVMALAATLNPDVRRAASPVS